MKLGNTQIPTPVIVFYSLATLWLVLYLTAAGRYNGSDFNVYLSAIERFQSGLSLYRFDEAMSFHYLPATLFFFLPLSWLPTAIQHLLIGLLSFLALLRMTWLCLSICSDILPIKSNKAFLILLLSPWLLINQGIGAQFESGNINLLLLYLTVEGFNQWRYQKPVLGLLLMTVPVLFKPAMLAIPYFTILPKMHKHLRSVGTVGLVLTGFTLLVFLIWGIDRGVALHADWYFSNKHHTHAILANIAVAVNFSLVSLPYHMLGWSVEKCMLLVFLPATLLFHFVILRGKSSILSFALAHLFFFLFSPASFPYSLIGLLFPSVLSLATLVAMRANGSARPLDYLCFGLFLVSAIFVTVNFLGRELYNSIAVPYRIQSLLVLPLILLLSQSFIKKLKLAPN